MVVRENIDVFLMTEEGCLSKETEKVTVFKENITEKQDKETQVFSMARKRPASNVDEETEKILTRESVRPTILSG